jgi:hypothetical protein
MTLHIHIYGPDADDEPTDEPIVQLHDADHHVLKTYDRGIDGWQIPLGDPA